MFREGGQKRKKTIYTRLDVYGGVFHGWNRGMDIRKNGGDGLSIPALIFYSLPTKMNAITRA